MGDGQKGVTIDIANFTSSCNKNDLKRKQKDILISYWNYKTEHL